MNYGTVRVLPATGNGVHGYGYGVGKPDPRYTRVQPYQKAMVKYTVRGYDFSINPVLYLEHPHECGHSKSCPHTRRNMFDSGVMALVFPEDGVTDDAFLWNGVSFIYNLRRGNLWCLGGYPCKWDGDSTVEAAHFLVEARCKTILANERGNGDETSW